MALLRVTDRNEQLVESLTIAAGIVRTAHLPNPAKTISISGYTQTSTPIPQLNEFFVNYSTGVISFNSGNSGTVSVTYFSLGENVQAQYINQLIDAITAQQSTISGLTSQIAALQSATPRRVVETAGRITGLPSGYHEYSVDSNYQPLELESCIVFKDDLSGYPVCPVVCSSDARQMVMRSFGAAYFVPGTKKIYFLDDLGLLTDGVLYRAYVSYLTLDPA